jgi:hypothetical protein
VKIHSKVKRIKMSLNIGLLHNMTMGLETTTYFARNTKVMLVSLEVVKCRPFLYGTIDKVYLFGGGMHNVQQSQYHVDVHEEFMVSYIPVTLYAYLDAEFLDVEGQDNWIDTSKNSRSNYVTSSKW